MHKTLAIGHLADVLADRYEIGRGVEVDAALIDEPYGSALAQIWKPAMNLSMASWEK